MPIEPVAYVAGAVVIFLAGLGTRELVEWMRGEIAFSRAIRGRLDTFAARWQAETGQPWGPIGNVPDYMAKPVGARDVPESTDPGDYQPAGQPGEEVPYPDDDEAHPHDEAREFAGAMRLPVEVPRGDADMAGWHVNPPYQPQRPGPGAHRAEPEPDQAQTRDLSSFVGVAAPPGVRA